jgi:hypothetical protein
VTTLVTEYDVTSVKSELFLAAALAPREQYIGTGMAQDVFHVAKVYQLETLLVGDT